MTDILIMLLYRGLFPWEVSPGRAIAFWMRHVRRSCAGESVEYCNRKILHFSPLSNHNVCRNYGNVNTLLGWWYGNNKPVNKPAADELTLSPAADCVDKAPLIASITPNRQVNKSEALLTFRSLDHHFRRSRTIVTEIDREPLYQLIKSGVQGEVCLPDDSWSSDFGGVIRRTPRVVVRPQHEQDVFHCFSVAKESGITVSFRGAGHSCHGQTLSDGGILIENLGDSADFKLLDDDQVEVSSKTRWLHLEKSLNEQGRSMPVVTDYLDLSIGGTLSVGGYGINSITRGAQVDHVTKLRLLLPDGTSRWCSENEHGDLFRYSLAGLGQMGFIDKVVTKTIPYRRFTRLYQYLHGNTVQFLDSLAWMQEWTGDWPSHFCALVGYGQILSEFGFEHSDQVEAEGRLNTDVHIGFPAPRFKGVHQDYRLALHESLTGYISDKDVYRIWADYAFDYSNFRRFVLFVTALNFKGVFGNFLDRIYILACRRPETPTAFPFEICGALPPPIKFGVGLYNTVPHADRRGLDQVTRAMEICLNKCLELGGKPYLYGWHELDAARMRKLYGPDYDRFLELKRQHDPSNIIESPWPASAA